MASEFEEVMERLWSGHNPSYSETLLDHARNPRNVGMLRDANAFASLLGPCEDSMEIWLKVRDGKVEDATFWTDGCWTTIACGSMATELAKGKTVAQALHISAEQIAHSLGGLPEDSIHCAGLAASTLKKAVLDYLNSEKEPWKKLYRAREQ